MGIARQGTHSRVTDNPDAVSGVLFFIERGNFRARHAVHHAVGHLQYGDIQPQLACGGRDFEADVAAAYNDQTFPRSEVRTDSFNIRDTTEVMHATQISARRGELAGFATGGKQQSVVSQRRAVIESESLPGSCNLLDSPAEMSLHAMICVELRGPNHQPIALQSPGEEFL